MNKSSIESKRHFRVIMGTEEHGLYISSTPSSAARKAVTKLCASNKNKKVEFYIREITQGSKKKTYGAYIGYLEKLKDPIKLKEYTIKYKPIIKLKDKLISKKLVMKGGAPKTQSSSPSSSPYTYVPPNAPISSPYNYVPPNNNHHSANGRNGRNSNHDSANGRNDVVNNNHHSANGRNGRNSNHHSANGWNNRHSEPNCCRNGTCNICGHPPMDRTASSIWDMIRFIDAYNSTSNNNRWRISIYSQIEGALWEMTNFSGHERLQYPDPEQCVYLCNSLSEIKDDEELEELLEIINKRFDKLFGSSFSNNKKEDGTREIQYVEKL
jgi:hypothetical protein